MILRRTLMLLAMLIAALTIAAGCGDDDTAGSGDTNGDTTAVASTPAPLEEGGEFLFCTDVPYPPAETQVGDEFVGYEIDIAREVAKRLGTTAEFQKTAFDGIIPALQAKKCDAIISSMNSTEERKQEVDFVDYMSVGQSILTTPELADSVETLEDLSGRTVAVQVGTTLRDAVNAENEELKAAGKEPIGVKSFPGAAEAANALRGGDVDAFFADSPVAAEYVNRDPEAFAFGGEPIDPLAVGIALRKEDDELQEAVQTAIDEMYEDGTMDEILEEWKIEGFALESADDGDGETSTDSDEG